MAWKLHPSDEPMIDPFNAPDPVMPTDDAREHSMDTIFSFLFGTREGLAVLFFGGIVIVAIVAFLLEKRTSKLYVDRGPKQDDDDGMF